MTCSVVMPLRILDRSAAFISVLTLACGCAEQKNYSLAPVSGTVTFDGKPLAGGIVNFQPQAAKSPIVGPGSVGYCDEQGHYTLSTIRKEPGAVVGTHRVRIYSFSPETLPTSDVDEEPPVEKIPERYNYQTRLEFTVPAEGSQEADFDLTSGPEG